MTDTPVNGTTSDENEFPETSSLRYNLDSLDDYIAVSETVAGEGRLDEAVDLLREATARYPESPTGRYNLGVALFLRVRKDREHLELWENLADDEQYAEEAIVALEDAIAADPKFTQAYNNLARLYALRGRKEDAMKAWTTSLELDPEQTEVRSEMVLYHDSIGPSDEDIAERKLMESDNPDRQL